MNQSKANQWIHVLLMVLGARLRALGDTPTRSVQMLAKRLGVAEACAHAMVAPVLWTVDPSRSAWGGTRTGTRLRPFGHDGTERCSERFQDPAEHRRYYRGKKTCHTVNNVLLINAMLTILLLSGPLC
jgi:hypothetical protein